MVVVSLLHIAGWTASGQIGPVVFTALRNRLDVIDMHEVSSPVLKFPMTDVAFALALKPELMAGFRPPRLPVRFSLLFFVNYDLDGGRISI